jgi:amidase
VDEHWLGVSVVGPIARSVRDASLLLDVLAGRPVQPLDGVEQLRVAVSLKSPSPLGRPDGHHRAAVDAARSQLEVAGHRVEKASPAYPMTMLNHWTAVWVAGIAEDVENFVEDEARLEPRTRTMARFGRRIARRGGPDRSRGDRWREKATEFFGDHDVLVTPAVARGPGRAGAMNGRGFGRTYLESARTVPFTQAWNWSGFPAVVVPVGERDGLPLTVQLIGLPDTERQMLAVAAQLSES